MTPPPYLQLPELVTMIKTPNREACRRFLEDNAARLSHARGSTHNHQAWEGGWIDHTTETMNIAVILYGPLNNARPHPFTLSDALLCGFLHDAEKPWKYDFIDGQFQMKPEMKNKEYVHSFVREKIAEYGFCLTDEHWNAIQFAEGELHWYSPSERRMRPLAAFVHMCDIWSARGWFDYPAQGNDPWIGARRSEGKRDYSGGSK